MRLPIIISTLNRRKLLEQTLASLRKNSDHEHVVIVVDDASADDTPQFLASQPDVISHCFRKQRTIAEVKNKGFELLLEATLHQPYVYFSDDDVFFEPHWDSTLTAIMDFNQDIGILGGRHHPHHKTFGHRTHGNSTVLIEEQQAGYSVMIHWNDFISISGYEMSERTTSGGEDSLLCDMIKAKGKLIAAVDPPVIIHCGLKNYRGLRAADYNEIKAINKQRPEILFL